MGRGTLTSQWAMALWRAPLLFFVLASAHAAEPPPLTAASALLFDANTGKVLFKKNENVPRPVASTQKLLTALLVAESGQLDDAVTIAPIDTDAQPTKLYLKPGETYTRRELLTALLVKSANDVARALARDNAGDLTAFADRMNARMARLGGINSHFVNPNGLPADEQFSTARDMACVARAVYFNPILRSMMGIRYFQFSYESGKKITLRNTNRVLRNYSFCNGMKTGYTDAAGHCLISSGSWLGKDMIAIVFGCKKSQVWKESASLLAYGLGLTPERMETLRFADKAPGEE